MPIRRRCSPAPLAAGFAASSAGTLSGQIVMDEGGSPLTVRRLLTLVPALVVLVAGAQP